MIRKKSYQVFQYYCPTLKIVREASLLNNLFACKIANQHFYAETAASLVVCNKVLSVEQILDGLFL
jgi:hypothetical protein